MQREQGVPPTQGDLIDNAGRRSQLSVSYSTCTFTCTFHGRNENCQDNAASKLYIIYIMSFSP